MIPQNALCKENAENCLLALDEIFDAIPKKRQSDFIGHLNDLALFLSAAESQLPNYEQPKTDEQP